MAASQGLIAALIALACLDLSFGQTAGEVCAVNQCPGGETCFNRNVPGQPAFVCQCDSPNEMGQNCLTATSDIDEIFTCYGSQCSTGTFSSPGWPTQVYTNRYGALYLLYVPGASEINFSFDSPFAIEELKDELYVGPGLSYTIDQLDGQTVANDHFFFEGSSVPASFSIASDTVWMVFLTDKNVQLDGFQIRWSAGDNTVPVISGCPSNIAQSVEVGTSSVVISWVEPTAIDDSGIVNRILRTHEPNTAFPVGPTTVTYIFQDQFSNNAVCSFMVIISTVDNVPPTISNCPTNMFENVDVGTGGTIVTWVEPTATDLSGVAVLFSRSHSPGDFFAAGTTTNVEYIFNDATGNEAICSFSVTIAAVDDQRPVISNCPSNININVELGIATAVATWVEPTATDNSGFANLVTRTVAPGSSFNLGDTQVTYIYSDNSNNINTCSFTVTVTPVDTVPPSILDCPSEIGRVVEIGSPGLAVTWDEPTATDLSGPVSLVSRSQAPGSTFPIGPTVVLYIFEDSSGNPATCSFLITINAQDTIAPVISNCPDSIVRVVELGDPGLIVTWAEPTATDNSGNAAFLESRTRVPGDFFLVGATMVMYTFVDATGNPAICSFTINVVMQDTKEPVIANCPANFAVTYELGTGGAIVSWIEPTATDLSNVAELVLRTNQPGDFFIGGDTTVRYNFADAEGNIATCAFTVSLIPDDSVPPTVSNCPSAITVSVELGVTSAAAFWTEPTATDASGQVTLQTRTAAPGDLFPLGPNSVTYIFVDSSGNPQACTFTVTVVNVDTTPPTISNCPSNMQVSVELGSTGATVTWLEPTATDLSSTVSLTTRSNSPGSTFPVGINVVTYRFEDSAGNPAVCSFTVTVVTTDTTPPTISNCPSNINQLIELGTPSVAVTWVEPTATDASQQVFVSRTEAPGNIFVVGPTTVRYTFTDNAGNPAICEFVITVSTEDSTPPTIQNCPADLSAVTELGSSGAIVTWVEPTAVDLSGTAVLVSRSRQPGILFPVGPTVVIYNFADAAGNPASCSFTVTVITEDTVRPTISNCPENIAVSIELGNANAVVTWVEPTATDLSGVANLVGRTSQPGATFLQGDTTVTYIFSDNSANTAVCSFTVTVSTVDTMAPVISNCPENIVLSVELGSSGTTVSWVEPTASDLSGTATLAERSAAPGSTFQAGTTVVTYNFVDSSGINAMCSFLVIVNQVDTVPPTIQNCPANIVEIIELGITSVVVSWTEPTAVDLSGTAILSSRSQAPGTPFPEGITTVLYTFTDSSNNPAVCQFVVTVVAEDTTRPTIQNCPANLNSVIELGASSGVVSWVEPTAVDASGAVTVVSRSHQPSTPFPLGPTIVTYIFADSSGNTATCTFTVTITTEDTTKPTISNCPDNVPVSIELGIGSAAAFWVEPTATDLSGVVNLVTRTASPGDTFILGPNLVTYIFSDNSGNNEVCTFNVIVSNVDTTPPVITNCPAPIPLVVELGITSAVAVWQEPTATDLSGMVSLTERTSSPGAIFPVGTTVVRYTFADNAGNPAVCSFIITITEEDTTPPTIQNCPANIVRNIELGVSSVVITWSEPTAVDSSGQVSLTSRTAQPGIPFTVGSRTVTYTFTDGSGNPALCEFVVTVVTSDTTPPTIQNCPTSRGTTVELGTNGAIVTWVEPTAVDLSGVANLLSRTHQPSFFFPLGPTQVIYMFVDASGNVAPCSFTVTVTAEDNTPPTIQGCPSNILITIELGVGTGTAFWVEPTATDLSGTTTLVTRTNSPGDVFQVGPTTVNYIFADSSGNSDSCAFDVIVSTEDTSPPVISNCPSPIPIVVELGSTGSSVTWIEPTATDLSGLVSLTERTQNPGFTFPVGTTVVRYTFTDGAGNPAVCSFVVTVTAEDNTPPTIQNCPASIPRTVELGTTSVVVTWVEPTATDLSGQVSLTLRSNQPGSSFLVGSTTVRYTFTDGSGNPATCEFFVIVTEDDTTPPTIQNCPTNLSDVVELGTATIPVTWVEPTAVDLSGVANLVSRSNIPGSQFPSGPTTVTYIFRDDSSNSATCSFTVTVVTDDTTRPVISNCPTNILLDVELGISSATAFWVEPTATDLSGVVNLVTRTASPGDSFILGPTAVTYIFSDDSGNSAVCSFQVTIESIDTTPPVISNCPANIPLVIELGSTGVVATWIEPTATDLDGTVSLVERTRTPGSTFPVGTTFVTYRFADNTGNPAVCTFAITVSAEDTTPPTIQNCPTNIVETIELGGSSLVITWTEPTATDASGQVSLTTRTATPGTAFLIGSRTVTYEFTDNSGNPSVCEFVVTILTDDTTRPVISNCPTNILLEVELGVSSATAFWVEPTATDLSGVVNLVTRTASPGDTFILGPTAVTYIFSDDSGNSAVCSFQVTIESIDTTPPVISNCPANIPLVIELGSTGVVATWIEPTATDLDGTVSLVERTRIPGSTFLVGTTFVTYRFADNTGNPAVCTFAITVSTEDTTPPTIQNCPTNIVESIELGGSSLVITWTEPTATDASGQVSLTTRTATPGTAFLIGSRTVTYEFTDNSGNPSVCEFVVTILTVDRTPPTIIQCPANILSETDITSPGIIVTWVNPTATDLSGTAAIIDQTAQSGSFFPVGVTAVRIEFADDSGNSAVCTFEVEVVRVDVNRPVILNCPANIQRVVEIGVGGIPVSYAVPQATDDSGTATLISESHTSGQFFPVGPTIVTYIFGDPAGNMEQCIFQVTVTEVDTTMPILSGCPGNIVQEVSLGTAGRIVTWTEPQVSDNSGIVNLVSQGQNSGSFFEVGTTPVIYIFADPSDNEVRCTFTVTVIEVDREPPTPVCSSDITVTVITGEGSRSVSWPVPVVTDNSGQANILSSTRQPGDLFLVGVTEVMYMFVDGSGNEASCSWNVIVIEANPCSTDPCQNGAACVVTSETEFFCVCPDCFSGDLCQFAINACTNNACSNGGVCVSVEGSCTQYTCECPSCFIGAFCDIPVDACDNNQCQNGGQCVQDNTCTRYTCQCPSCFTGRFCEVGYNACDDNTCLNGAGCTSVAGSCTEYTCTCPSCFTGAFCEIAKTACNPNPCQNNGNCVTSFDSSCFAYSCQCQGCFTGFNCEVAIAPACDANPCSNGAVCSDIPGTCGGYTCQCQPGFTGTRCQEFTAINQNPCNSSPCDNGASCLTMDGNYYICVCRDGYRGINCGQSTTPSDPITCSSNPCVNGATCRESYNSNSSPQGIYVPQYTCICNTGFTGANCQLNTVDTPSLDICNLGNRPPCDNGGACANNYHSFDQDVDYFCFCPPGFIGHNCETETTNPCDSSPCQNSAFCSAFNTYYTCTCQTGYGGITCETITSADVTGPTVANCPSTISVNVPVGSVGEAVWIEPTATDASGGVEVVFQSSSPGSQFSLGTTPVAYVFVDAYRNPTICLFFVRVTSSQAIDTTRPEITGCPEDISVEVPVGVTSSVAFWVEPTATDNSQVVPTVTTSASPGSEFNLGPTIVTYIFTDAANNQAMCQFSVIVTVENTDTSGPIISGCPSNVVVNIPGGMFGSASWTAPTATDESGVAQLVSGPATSSGFFPLGPTTVRYVFEDASGNEATCSFEVIISTGTVDNTPPVISGCPSGVVVTTAPGASSAVAFWNVPTAMDDSGMVTISSVTASPGDSFQLGPTNVIYTFSDPSGNPAVCSFVVVVNAGTGDVTPPTISGCPTTLTVPAQNGLSGAFVDWVEPTATDASGIAGVVSTANPGDFFFTGVSTTVTYQFTDNANLVAECEFNVVVVSGSDVTPPVISNCPNDITQTLPAGSFASVSWTAPTAVDETSDVTVVGPGAPVGFFRVGSTAIMYTFTDAAGNPATCSFTITIVSGGGGDTSAPVISGCPSGVQVTAAAGASSAVAFWIVPTATDDSGTASLSSASASPGDSFLLGETEVVYVFSDPSGNPASCIFSVVVNSAGGGGDTSAPVISGCPSIVVVSAAAGASSAVAFWNVPTATDNSGTASLSSASASPGDSFLLGVTEVVYVFSDPSGNPASCIFSVVVTTGQVVDNDRPVISGCPEDIFQQVTPPVSGAIISWTEPTATDAVSEVTVQRTAAPGIFFGLGPTLVLYTFTDAAGNNAFCQFTVTVTSAGVVTNPPVISNCPVDPIERIVGSVDNEGVVSWTPEPSALSDLGEVTVTQSHNSGDTFLVGPTTVTYSFGDVLGNQANCSFMVVVVRGPNPCSGDPCPENTSCFYSSDQFLCRPAARRRRDLLSSDDLCPCKNNGTCQRVENTPGAYCKCPPGFSGILCDKVEIYLKGTPGMRIDTQWSMVAVMGILVVVILVLAFTLYSMSARVVATRGKHPDEVAIIH